MTDTTDSTWIEKEDEDEEQYTASAPEAIKRLETTSESESDRNTDGENDVSRRNPSKINRRGRKKIVRKRRPSNTSVSNSSIQSDSNHSIYRECQKIYSNIPKLNGQAPVFLTSSLEHGDDDGLTDLPGLQDRSEINDSDSDNAEESTPTKPSKPSTIQYLMSELQSRLNHNKKEIQRSSGQ